VRTAEPRSYRIEVDDVPQRYGAVQLHDPNARLGDAYRSTHQLAAAAAEHDGLAHRLRLDPLELVHSNFSQ
jgi:hypothetical protein